MARLFVVHIGVVALCRNTSAVEAGKADVDPLKIVLRSRTKESERVARDAMKLIQG